MEHKHEKVEEVIHHLANDFIKEESNHTSMITVTKVELSKDFKKAIIFVTVLPSDQETAVSDFLRRNRSEFREYAKKNSRMRRVPLFDFMIDEGEKARQRIDEISREVE